MASVENASTGLLRDLGPYPSDMWKEADGKLLHELFREQVPKTPDAPAVSDGVNTITYRELDDLSDRMAFWLKEQGCGMETVGVIYMNKQIEYVIAYVAILKSSAAYLPMDVAYPPDLIEMVLKDAEPKAIITTPEYYKSSGSRFGSIPFFVCGPDWKSQLGKEKISPQRPPGMTWENMAYTIYTSGTTGQPKGIVCPHRGAVLSYTYRHEEYPYVSGETEAANVFLVWELLRPLIKGAHLFVIPDDVIYDVDALPIFIEKNQINRMLFTPSLLDAVLSNPEVKPARLQSLKLIIYCGEVVTVALRNKCRQMMPDCRLHNLYSISETHDATGSDVTADSSLDLKRTFCPVGKLLPYVNVFVLDEKMEDVPPGVQGEVYISGPYLARGYLRRPELTALRFVEHKGVRMYRTGDFGYLRRSDNLEICGRCDSMVKVRGYSIEILAVQKALQEMTELVSDAIVIAHGEAAATEKTLVAYIIVPAHKHSLPQHTLRKELRALLKRRLPFYMVPTYIEFMTGFPTAAIGKVDKKALPSLASIREKQGSDCDNMPATPAEVKVAQVFAKVINLTTDKLDVSEGFFDLGGNSLLTIPLLRELTAVFDGRKVTLEDLFVYPSISELACFLTGEKNTRDAIKVIHLPNEVLAYSGPPDISMNTRAFWRHSEAQKSHKTSRVLMSGATGFLGSFVLCEFLRSTRSYLYCLARVAEACRKRLINNLKYYGLYTEDVQKGLEERLDVLVGDAGLQNMGLDDDEYHFLSQHVDTVVHVAALVNLMYPYDALVAANVRGTSNMVAFCQTGKVKALHHVSSDAVFPLHANGQVYNETDSIADLWKDLHSGYAQSKWVAEHIVRQAFESGLPGVIYRCGNIAGHSTTGAWNWKDSNLAIIKACLVAGAVPVVKDLSLTFEFTPVDFIAKFMVSCAENIRYSTNKTFHLIQPHHLDMQGLLEAATRAGYANIAAVSSIEEWVQCVEAASEAAGIQPVTQQTLIEICQLQNRAFSNTNVAGWLAKMRSLSSAERAGNVFLPPAYPVINAALLSRYLMKLANTWKVLPSPAGSAGLDAPPSTSTSQSLHMRLVIVAGAASDMGWAVAMRLAENGARVAALDADACKLEQLAKEAAMSGGVVLAVPLDLCDLAAVRAGVEKAEGELTSLTWGLVNCCSRMQCEAVSAGNAEAWGDMLDHNCRSVLNVTGAAMNSLTSGDARRGGHIINITSGSSQHSCNGLAAYSATKHFIESWSRGLRRELAPLGIRVTNIQPGSIHSEIKMHFGENADRVLASGGHAIISTVAPSVSDVAEAVLLSMASHNTINFNDIMVEPLLCFNE